MRKVAAWLITVFLAAGVLTMLAVSSAAEYSSVVFEDAVQIYKSGGYPRFTALQNKALECYYEGRFSRSLDSGATFADDMATTNNAASTHPHSDGVNTHTLTRANHHALELSDGTMMMAYRSHTKGGVYEGEFYTSIRVQTRTNYLAEYGNETVVVQAFSTAYRGFWEPFLIQLDDTTVAMYYADDLSPGDNGANQYIMLVLYDITTGTWGEPKNVINSPEQSLGREGMPMVAKLADGSGYVMAVESECMTNRNYRFVVRLWFSQDGITWDKNVVVATPAAGLWDLFRSAYGSAAPCVTVLPDGRLAVSYQDDYENRNRNYQNTDNIIYNAVPCVIVSKTAVSYSNCSSISGATNGVSASFTKISHTLNDIPALTVDGVSHSNDVYGIWNSVFYSNGYLYLVSGVGYNISTTEHKSVGVYACRAQVDANETPVSETVASNYGILSIRRPEQLLQIMNDSTMWNKKIALENDIDLSDSVYDASRGIVQTPIGYLNTAKFTGTFDGKGYTITGININNTVEGNRTGLFGYCDGVTIKNCTMYGNVTSNGEFCGAFAGYSQNSHFENLISYVTVSGKKYVGGIAGRMLGGSKGGSFVNCVNKGSVSGTSSSVGGIVGILDTNKDAAVKSTVNGCVNYGDVSGSGYVGGIIGCINHLTEKASVIDVLNCANYGSVSASSSSSCVAGIVGQTAVMPASGNSGAACNGVFNLKYCENHGSINGYSYVAGIAANVNFQNSSANGKLDLSECKNYGTIGNADAVAYVAGIAGRTLGTKISRAEISLCYNEGAVISGSTGKDMGGIVGVAMYTDVSDCESRGSVTTSNTVAAGIGGIIGRTSTSISVKRCYFTGVSSLKPIVGNSAVDTEESNYYYVTSSVEEQFGSLVELEKGEAFYEGLDFDKVWYATVLGPRLRYGKTFLKGDIDGNGAVEVLDVVILQRYLAGWDGYAKYIVYDSADVYDFGVIDVCDAVVIIRHLVGWVGYETFGNN